MITKFKNKIVLYYKYNNKLSANMVFKKIFKKNKCSNMYEKKKY